MLKFIQGPHLQKYNQKVFKTIPLSSLKKTINLHYIAVHVQLD